jgi:serine/threonine protein kinase/tetratricopeptide (TPR) repeat protein
LLAERYEVVRELGRGGMGVVYLCRDRFTYDLAALKRLQRGEGQPDPEDAWWFQQEARCLASLDHPSIVQARDFGILPDGTPFLVMDVAPGRSLLSWLEIGAIPWPWPYTVLWSFIDQVLAGLAHAHARGVIHGDLKPTNLMLDFPGPSSIPRVFLLDLGLASLVRDLVDHRLDGQEGSPPVVRAGAGTPGWMAPEQIRRATPHYGPPTDLYAIGSILYHLLSGREPFTGTVDEILDGHRNHPLPDFQLPSNVPEGAKSFVQTLMAKRPWQRFEFAGDARRAWERLRPAIPIEGWSFRAPLEPLVSETDRASNDGFLPPPSGSVEAIASSASALGLLGLRPSPLVARHEERAELGAIVDEAIAPGGRPHRLVLLYGEAGVGKSRLAEWLCDDVHERAIMLPLRARYRRIPAPLDGIVGAVNAHFGLEHADRNLVEKTLLNCWEISKTDDEGLTFVAAAAEWLRPSPPGQTIPLGPTGKRFFFDTPEVRRRTIRRVLEKVGERRPLLLWLDDLHLASERAFELLSKLRQDAPLLRILMVATARSEALAVDANALARLEALRHLYSGRVIELRPLSPGDTEMLLRSSLPLEAAAVKRATARSRGNPLFALQLLHAWAASNRLQLEQGVYTVPAPALEEQPGSTAELWDERIQAIPPELRRAALAAASLGGDIPLVCLRALLQALRIPVNPAIEALHRAQILIPAAPGRLRWPHNLLQEHLLARQIERADAKHVFRCAADALALHPAAGTRRVVSHRITNLLRAGDEVAVADRVLEFVESNWRRVRDVGATLNDLSRLEGLVAGPATAAYARWRAEALRHVGRFAEARELADRARRAFASMNDAKNEAHCLRIFGHVLAIQSVPSGRDHVVEALAKFETVGDVAGRAECELVLGEIDYFRGQHDPARNWLKQAVRHFSKISDPLGHGRGLVLLGLTDLASGRKVRAKQLLDAAHEEFERVGHRLGVAECEIARGHLAHRADELELALAHAERARKMMQDLKNPRGEAACQRLLSMLAFDTHDLMRSREHALAASAIYDQMGEPRGQVEASLLLAQVALATKNPVASELLRACEAIGLVEAETRQHLGLSKAWLLQSQGSHEEATTELVDAKGAFGTGARTGDHARQLVVRLAQFPWPRQARQLLDEWLGELGFSRRERRHDIKIEAKA